MVELAKEVREEKGLRLVLLHCPIATTMLINAAVMLLCIGVQFVVYSHFRGAVVVTTSEIVYF